MYVCMYVCMYVYMYYCMYILYYHNGGLNNDRPIYLIYLVDIISSFIALGIYFDRYMNNWQFCCDINLRIINKFQIFFAPTKLYLLDCSDVYDVARSLDQE